MKRVLVIGPGGAGKSAVAKRLGRILSLEVIHLDQFFWKAGWVEPAKEEWHATVERLLSGDSWIIDGNYSGTLERRLKSADTIIFLDFPRMFCIWRVIKRVVTHFHKTRPDMAPGCPERFTLQFLIWIWNYPRRTRPKIVKLLTENASAKTVLTLRSQKEVERFLDELSVTQVGCSSVRSMGDQYRTEILSGAVMHNETPRNRNPTQSAPGGIDTVGGSPLMQLPRFESLAALKPAAMEVYYV